MTFFCKDDQEIQNNQKAQNDHVALRDDDLLMLVSGCLLIDDREPSNNRVTLEN